MNTCKSPDKIFLPGDIDLPSAAILTLGNQPGDVEYIRKDTLLEWLNQGFDWVRNPLISVQQVIDKIESL